MNTRALPFALPLALPVSHTLADDQQSASSAARPVNAATTAACSGLEEVSSTKGDSVAAPKAASR